MLAIISLLFSLKVDNNILSGILGYKWFCVFMGNIRIISTKERVKKGWFPDNPKLL